MPSTEHPLTILLVDDDTTLLDVIGRVLKRDGHTVVQGNDVAEALEMADRHVPDLALVDLSLPDGDGVSLADRLHERYPELPLILMTAYPIRVREDPGIAGRFTRVMIKPLNLEELRGAVRESVRREPAAGASVPHLPSVAASVGQVPNLPETEAGPTPAPQASPHSPDRWHWLKSGAMVAVALVVLALFLVYISGVPVPGLSAGPEATAAPPPPLDVELAKDAPHTLIVPDDVKKALGIRRGDKDDVDTAAVPTEMRPLILTGSTALDPNEVLHVRARFAPAKVVEIGQPRRDLNPDASSLSNKRELRVGDRVEKGDLLGVFFSDAVGSQKNALFDSESQRRLDQDILDRAEASPAAVEVFILNARRNVEADINHSNQAANTLRTWGIPEKDIQKIIDEAKASNGSKTLIAKEKYEDWGRVELRADQDGVLVERNIPQNELIQDPTVSLFQIAKVNNLQVIANASEDDLKTLLAMPREKRWWTVRTVNAPPEGILAPIDDIGYLVDPNQHSAVIKGHIPNPDGKIRGAQLVTAAIPLDPPSDVVEIDVSAVADDGSGRTFVFVQADEEKSLYTLRRVKVTHRFDKVVYVKSKLDPKEAGPEALHEGDKVLKSGVLELKAELEDRESNAGKGS